MNTIQQFFVQHGATVNARGIVDFSGAENSATESVHQNPLTVAALTNLDCFWIKGLDAKKFLQGQVTCDVNQIVAAKSEPGEFRRGAHCNTKGRMLFDFVALSTIDNDGLEAIAIITESSLLETAQAALKKYMVFSKATLHTNNDPTNNEALVAIGIIGNEENSAVTESWLAQTFHIDIPQHVQQLTTSANGHILKITPQQYLCLLKQSVISANWSQLTTNNRTGGQFQWDLAEIRAGLGHVRQETAEEFIPQDLNFQLVDGVNFKKGCYIGQEIVARLQYRGTLKRHMRRAQITLENSSENLPLPGTKLYTSEKEQSIGTVVQSAPIDSDTIELLALINDDVYENDGAYLDTKRSQKLRFLPLPYAITN